MWKTLFIAFLYFPTLAQTRPEQVKALFAERKYEQIKKLLVPIRSEDADYAAAQYYLGRIAFIENKLDVAQDYLEEAVAREKKVADYHYWLGATYGSIARDANVFKQGILAPKIKTEFEETVKLDPTNINALQGLVSYYSEAPGFMGGSYDKAKDVAKKISTIDVAQGHDAMAAIYSSQEKFADAEREYIAASKADPALTVALGNFYIRQKQFEKAFALYEGIIVNDPLKMSAVYQVGKASAISGLHLDRGEECLKKYLNYTPQQNEPSKAGAYMRLGQVYEKKGNKPEARKMFEAALKLDGSLKEAKEGLKRTSV